MTYALRLADVRSGRSLSSRLLLLILKQIGLGLADSDPDSRRTADGRPRVTVALRAGSVLRAGAAS